MLQKILKWSKRFYDINKDSKRFKNFKRFQKTPKNILHSKEPVSAQKAKNQRLGWLKTSKGIELKYFQAKPSNFAKFVWERYKKMEKILNHHKRKYNWNLWSLSKDFIIDFWHCCFVEIKERKEMSNSRKYQNWIWPLNFFHFSKYKTLLLKQFHFSKL